MPTYMIRDAVSFSESFEVDTGYTMEQMVAALRSDDSDCGFVGEFMDKILSRDVHVAYSELSSFQYDVLSFVAAYEDRAGDLRYMEVRVLEVF